VSTPDVDTMKGEQSRRIFDHLEGWLAARPGRSLIVTREHDGTWIVTLDETLRWSGESLRDAAGQCAQTLAMGGGS